MAARKFCKQASLTMSALSSHSCATLRHPLKGAPFRSSWSVVAATSVLALALAAIFLPGAGSTAEAQSRCKSFHAVLQFVLPTPAQFDPADTWGGPVFGNLDSMFLQGGISGNDETEIPHGSMSIFKDGLYRACLTSAPAWGGPNDCPEVSLTRLRPS